MLIALVSDILECLEYLESVNVNSRRLRDRVRHVFKRDELQEHLGIYMDKMRSAKEQLSVRSPAFY